MKNSYDTIVVGSGAGGGMAAYVLTQRGLKVLLLEAGRDYNAALETPMFQVEADAPLNGASTPDKSGGYFDGLNGGGISIPGEPYAVAQGSRFYWIRGRLLGGRTNHWGQVALRYGPHDFHTYSRHGLGMDWPISYEDIAPYYDRVEKLIGVYGGNDGIENSPDSPPGVLLPPPTPRAYELWAQMALGKRMNIRVVANRGAILTKPLNGRPACLYATDCHRGCAIRANFQTPTVLLPPALASGRLEIRTRAMVYEVPVDKRGRVTGVRYIDVSTGAAHFVAARAVVLAASACETARILLNSKSTAFPNGLVNGSGQVGRNLTDSISTSVSGEIPALKGLPPFNDDGTSIGHVYIPWGALRGKAAGEPSFATEYHIHMFGGRAMPKVAQFHRLPHESGKPLYGQPLRQRIRRDFGCRLTLGSWGGMIPNADSRCEMDGDAKDRWGIPTLRFHWKLGQQEIAQARHARATMREMIEAMGGALYNDPVGDGDFIAPGGTLAHEIGTARMGAKATDSVLNAFGHAWEVRNLYVADGAAFTSHSDKNPTETILALAWRASDHLADSCIRKEI